MNETSSISITRPMFFMSPVSVASSPKSFALTAASISRLPEMRKQLRELARAVKALEEAKA